MKEVGEWRGVFEGVGGVGVEKAAAVGAEHFDRDLGGDGALGDGLGVDDLVNHHGGLAVGGEDGVALVVGLGDLDGVGIEDLGGGVGLEVLDDALRDEEEGEDQTERGEQVVSDADGIDPEVADGLGGVAGDAAHEGGGDGDAGGGRGEVVNRQCDHLREIRHGRFAAVALPVGVGREARGGVEGEGGRESGEALRIQRQAVLVTQDEIGEQQADEAEDEEGDGVGEPTLFFGRIDAADAVGEALDGLHEPVEKRAALGVEDFDQIEAERLGDEQQSADEKGELEPGVGIVHGRFVT